VSPLPVIVIFAINLSIPEEAARVRLEIRRADEAAQTVRVILKTVDLGNQKDSGLFHLSYEIQCGSGSFKKSLPAAKIYRRFCPNMSNKLRLPIIKRIKTSETIFTSKST